MEKSFVNQKTLEQFVSQLINVLEDVKSGKASVERWKQAWKNMQSRYQNPTTGSFYNGVNVLSCLLTQWYINTDESRFLTFNKARELAEKWGMNPGKDNPIISWDSLSKNGTPIMYWGVSRKEVINDNGEKEEKVFRFVTGFRLHNLSLFSPEFQTKFNEVYGAPVEIDRTIPSEIENFVSLVNVNVNAEVVFTNETSGPVYYPLFHKVKMPFPSQYGGNLEVLKHDFLHEMAHATKKVCGRDLKDYAKEEIVAETAASFACLEMGIEPPQNYLDYVLGWLKGNKPQTVMSLFGHIETATAILMGRYTPKVKEEQAEQAEQIPA